MSGERLVDTVSLTFIVSLLALTPVGIYSATHRRCTSKHASVRASRRIDAYIPRCFIVNILSGASGWQRRGVNAGKCHDPYRVA